MQIRVYVKTALSVALLATGISFFDVDHAEAETLTCPASINVKTQNTPRGWAATLPPHLFESAKIKPSGNRRELRCNYSNGAKLTRLIPLNTQCKVSGNGFECDAIATAQSEPPVHLRSSMWLTTNQTGDLDTGNTGGNGADVLLGVSALEGLGSTRFSDVVGKGDYARCSQVATRFPSLSKSLLKPNVRFCARLSSGRLASVLVSRTNGNNIQLAFRTWERE